MSYQNSKQSPCDLQEIVGVGGEKHKVLGQFELHLLISSAKISSKFYVLDSLHHSLILGINFLKCHDAYLDLQAGTLFVKDKTVCAFLIGNKAGLARLEKYTKNPAHCE